MVSDPLRADCWVAATGNAGKLGEMRALLAGWAPALLGLGEVAGATLPPEGDSYEENAVGKARAVCLASGRPALGDDSGLEVDALGGRPGPHSARYGGPGLDDAARAARLVAELAGLAPERRQARFVCVVALATPDGAVRTARGVCEGVILHAPRGDAGFGYDPVFAPVGLDLSMAELPADRKNALSHRGRALLALRRALRAG